MHLRKWVLTALLGGSCALTMAASSHAAVSGGMAEPDSAWAVSRLESRAQDGAPYCALARRYDNDFVLTLARNNKDKASIAIDFQRPVLENTENYTVALDPGFGKAREFTIQPVSTKALVIRLGQDYAFLDALSRSQALTVRISDREFGFHLPDFSGGQEKLDSCLAALVEPAAGQVRTVEAIRAIPPKRESEMLTPIAMDKDADTAAQAALEKLKTENLKLRNQLRAARQNVEEPSQAALVSELTQEVELLQRQNSELRSDLQKKEVNTAQAQEDQARAEEMLIRITALQEKNKALQAALEQEKKQNRSLAEELTMARNAFPQEKTTEQSAVIADLKAQLENAERSYQSKIDTFEQQLAQSEQKYESLARQLALQKTEDSGEIERIAALESKLEDEQKTIAALRNDLVNVKDKAEALRIENQQLRVTLAQNRASPEDSIRAQELSERLALIEEEKARMREKIERQQQELAALSAKDKNDAPEMLASAALAREVDELRQDNMRLRHQLRQQQNVASIPDSGNSGQMEELKERLAMLERENEQLRQTAARRVSAEPVALAASGDEQKNVLVRELEAELADMKQQNQQLQLVLEEQRLKNENLAMQLARNTGQNDPEQADRLAGDERAMFEDQIDSMRKQLQTQREAYTALEEKYRQARSEPAKDNNEEVTALREKLEARKADFALLEERIAALQAEKKVHQAAAESLKQEVASLEDVNEDLRLKLREREKVAVLKPEVKDMAARISQMEAELSYVTEERDRLAEKVDAIREGRGDEALSITSSNWDLEKATRRYNEAEREIRRLGRQLEMARNQCNREKQDLEQMLFDPEITEREQISRMMEMKEAVAQCEDQLASLQGRESRIRLSGSGPQVGHDRLAQDSEFARLQKKARMLEDELNNRIKANAQMQNRMQVMREELEEAKTISSPQTSEARPVSRSYLGHDKVVYVPQALKTDEEDVWSPSLANIAPAAGAAHVAGVMSEGAATESRHAAAPSSFAPGAVDNQVIRQPLPREQVEPGHAASLMGRDEMAEMLNKAGLDLKTPVSASRQGNDFVSYNWSTGNIYGQAEQRAAASMSFSDQIRQYINKTKQKCDGEFAAVPGPASQNRGDIASYEIACIADGASASAAVLFYRQDGVFTAIAHETGVDHIDAAMNIRDRLLSALHGDKIVSR